MSSFFNRLSNFADKADAFLTEMSAPRSFGNQNVHNIRVGDVVIARYPPYRSRADNPWFRAQVVSVSPNQVSVKYADGDVGNGLASHEVYYSPNAPATCGKGAMRQKSVQELRAMGITCTSVTFGNQSSSESYEFLRGEEDTANEILSYSKSTGPHRWEAVREELRAESGATEEEFVVLARALGFDDSQRQKLVTFDMWNNLFAKAIQAGVLDGNKISEISNQIHPQPTLQPQVPTAVLGTSMLAEAFGSHPTPTPQSYNHTSTRPSSSSSSSWIEYCSRARNDPKRKAEMGLSSHASIQRSGEGSVQRGSSTMKFTYKTKGSKPKDGYPIFICLHGGGSCPAATNDSQYNIMKSYWAGNCLEHGIYVACRGVTNSWKLHWEDDSFACYDRIISNCITLLEGDSNRVYLMGYSAGGDAAYRIPPVLSDTFAAANMCAGHPNGVGLTHFMHCPLLLQCGELDTAYNRHRITAEQGAALQRLRLKTLQELPSQDAKTGPFCTPCSGAKGQTVCTRLQECQTADCFGMKVAGPYLSEVRIHANKSHSAIGDWGRQCQIVSNPNQWLSSNCARGSGQERTICSDSVGWCNQFVRNPAPDMIQWNPKVSPPRGRNGRQLYHFWVDISRCTKPYDGDLVTAKITRRNGITTITVYQCGSQLSLLVNRDVMGPNWNGTLRIIVENFRGSAPRHEWYLQGSAPSNTAERTLLQREDPSFIYNAEIFLERKDQRTWELFAEGFQQVRSSYGGGGEVPKMIPNVGKIVFDFSQPLRNPIVRFRSGANNTIDQVILPSNAVRSNGNTAPWVGICQLLSNHNLQHGKLVDADSWYTISLKRAENGFTWEDRFTPRRGKYVLVLVARGATENLLNPLSKILLVVE
eukprot:g4780.t1